MKRFLPFATATALVFSGCSEPSAPLSPPEEAQFAASLEAPIYLVMFKDGVTDVRGAAHAIARVQGTAPRFVWEAIGGFSMALPEARLEAVKNDPRVKMVDRNQPISLIRPVAGPAARPGSGGGQRTPYGITRVGGPQDGTGKTAWVIDTGIDLEHTDLNTSKNCHANFVTRGKNSADDGQGHGTHVAGTIGAINNSQDVVGVAPNAYLCAVRVLDNSGSGTWEGVTNGVDYVAANAAAGDVANMSLGGTASGVEPNSVEEAILRAADKGIIFSLAAGNDGADANGFTPARIGDNHANIYTISAINDKDCMPSWSNWGNPPVEFAEPGVSILSTKNGGGTTTMSGTSMAAPHAAGLLLFGKPNNGGPAQCDPDGNPDIIGVF